MEMCSRGTADFPLREVAGLSTGEVGEFSMRFEHFGRSRFEIGEAVDLDLRCATKRTPQSESGFQMRSRIYRQKMKIRICTEIMRSNIVSGYTVA